MKPIISNAYNMPEFINTGVDPRTGAYSLSLFLGNFRGHSDTTSLSISLSYNAGNALDVGFGRGWSLPFSQFSNALNRLYLSCGQSFTVRWNPAKQTFDMPYRKLKDIRVSYIEASQELKVAYKNGQEEYLGWDEGELRRIVFPHGAVIYFDYAIYQFNKVLWRIYDGQGREFIIDWWSNEWQTTVNHTFNDQVIQNITFSKSGNGVHKRLVGVNHHDLLFTTIAYRYINACDYDVIESIVHPSGLSETMSYKDNGHSLPHQAPISSIPYITRHVTNPGANQPERIAEYDYSDNNYLGFASDRAWKPGEDTLFKARENYRYTSTETINSSLVITRTYNKYHLMELAAYSFDGRVFKEERYDYFADLSQNITAQKAIYSLVHNESTIFYDGSNNQRTYSKQYEYDDYANLLKVTEPDGSIKEFHYYPKNGTETCPPDPNGFVSRLQNQIFIPDAKQSDTSRKESYTYLSLPRLDDMTRHFCLLASISSEWNGTQKQFTYCHDINDLQRYGRSKSEIIIIGGKPTTRTYQYTFSETSIETETTEITYDNLSQRFLQTIDLLNGHIKKSITASGIEITYDYDSLGRTIRETIAPGTAFEASNVYEYTMGGNNNSVSHTDPQGNVLATHLNNAGQPIAIELQGKTIQRMHYNAFGFQTESEQIDYLTHQQITLTTHYSYDVHGQISRVEHPDGRIETIEQNPVSLTTVTEMVNLQKERTQFNLSGQPIYKETLDTNGQRLAKSGYTFDGYGNLRSTTDNKNRVTQFSYDAFDRVMDTTRMLGDSNVTESLSYSPYLDTQEPDKIIRDGIVLATQHFDGFGRKIGELTARGKREWHYTEGCPLPQTESTPHGDTVYATYNPYLDVVTSINVDNDASLAKLFHYDQTSGDVQRVENADSEKAMSYDALGRVVSETITLTDGRVYRASYTYSLLGKLETQTDFFGNVTDFKYDASGRLKQVIQNIAGQTYSTTINYDAFSRPSLYKLDCGDNTATVEILYNSMGLETERKFHINDYTQKINYFYNTDNRLSKRINSDSHGNETIEIYYYDDLARLTKYSCYGNNAPMDEYGNAIKNQRFIYDNIGNIISVMSTFSDRTQNTMNFTFDEKIPDRLIRINNSHRDYPTFIDFEYDAAGNCLNDDHGLRYTYNALDQVSSVSKDGQQLSTYQYNALGEVISQTIDELRCYFVYQLGELRHEVNQETYTVQTHHKPVVYRSVINGNDQQHEINLTDTQGSVITQTKDAGKINQRWYSAYGQEGTPHE